MTSIEQADRRGRVSTSRSHPLRSPRSFRPNRWTWYWSAVAWGASRGQPSWRPVINYTPSAMSARDETGPGAMRIDRWLFGVRLFKSRSSAADAVGGGRVHLNGERVKPSHGVKPGETVIFPRRRVCVECVVAAVPLRRGPASEAARFYYETPASKGRREVF